VTSWGLQIGWGTDKLATLAGSANAPAFVLADRLWNGASLIVLIALINSGLGVCIACTTSATRTIYGIARTGALPTFFTRVQPKHRTPITAVVVQSLIAFVVCLGVGIPIFILMNIAAFLYFRKVHPEEFNVWAYVIAPIVSTASLLAIAYYSLVPLPAFPVVLAPFIAIAYALIGVIILVARNLRPGKTAWMARAGELPEVDEAITSGKS
jgi:amino acid transporter